jgi:hypothetical protein
MVSTESTVLKPEITLNLTSYYSSYTSEGINLQFSPTIHDEIYSKVVTPNNLDWDYPKLLISLIRHDGLF